MRLMKAFSFTSEDKEILHYIEKQPNQSFYIKDLVKKDMENKKEESIEVQIIKVLQSYGINTSKENKNTP